MYSSKPEASFADVTSTQSISTEKSIPDGIKGWSWGAFLLNWIWAIRNRVWIGLLTLIPYIGVLVAIWLGFKGREMAWKARQWESVEHFDQAQKKWSQWGVGIWTTSMALGILGVVIALLLAPSESRRKTSDVDAISPVEIRPAPAPALAPAHIATAPSVPHEAPQLLVPPLEAHVNDLIGLLSDAERTKLDATLSEYERRSGHQIAILLVNTTAPETIDQYSVRVANAWKLGNKRANDGILFVVARDNPRELKRLRIEVGNGLTASFSDEQSATILQDVIVPRFKNGDFSEGLASATAAVISTLDAHEKKM